MIDLQEGELVLGTVTQIEGTSVFVKLPGNKNGTIITSEIAPGRIRNIREYVMLNKKIVCKVLRISPNNIDLSLRRVTSKEKSEVMEQYKQEQTAKSALKSLLKDKAQEVEEKILAEFETLSNFFTKAREDEKLIPKYFNKEMTEQIRKIVQKRKKEVEVRKIIKLKCMESNGISRIKEILYEDEETIEIVYLSAGTFQIKVKDIDYKKANQRISDFAALVEKKAKSLVCEYSIEDKK